MYQHDPDAVASRKPAHMKLTKGQTLRVEAAEAYLMIVQILLWLSAAYKTFNLGEAIYSVLRYERNIAGAVLLLLLTSLGIGVLVVGALRVRSRPLLWCSVMTVLVALAIGIHVETGNRSFPPPSLLNLSYLGAFVVGICAAFVVRNQPLPRSQWSPRDIKAARIIQLLTVVASGVILLAAGAVYELKKVKAPLSERVSEALEGGIVADVKDLRIDEFIRAWNSADTSEAAQALLQEFILPKAQRKLLPRYLESFQRYGWTPTLPDVQDDPRARAGRDQVMVVFRFVERERSSQLVTIWSPSEGDVWHITKLFREDDI